MKRPRGGSDWSSDLKRAAEIVMVLSAMGEMRAGRDPTPPERTLAAEARELLAGMCEDVKPKDLFARDAIRVVVDDLGLNCSVDPGYRPPKMSIADKLLLAKKEIEESKEFATHYSPRPLQVLDLTSATTSLKQPHVYGTQLSTTVTKPSVSPLVKDSPLTPSRTEAEHFRLDVRPTRPSYLTQVPAEYVVSKASQETMNQGMQTSVLQTMPEHLFVGHQSSQGLNYVHANLFFTNHNDIAKSVQMILQKKVSDHPNWTPPSTDYMNTALNCQICKIIINDGESLLVCDACEKGAHLGCLHYLGNKSIPKADWHCPKCVMSSTGKPFPPKYGRVTRTIATSKTSSNIHGTHAAPEQRAEHPDRKVNKKIVPNGISPLPCPVYASNMVSTSKREMQGVSGVMKMEDGMSTGTLPYLSKEREIDGVTCTCSGTQSESSDKQVKSKGVSPYDKQISNPETMLESKIILQKACSKNQNRTSEDHLEAPNDTEDCNSMELPTRVKKSEDRQHAISGPSTLELELCELGDIPKHEGDCDIRLHDCKYLQVTPNGVSDTGGATIDCGRLLSSDLHTVDWVGDILEVIEEKIYYPSCCIKGRLHKLQDNVLVSSTSRDMCPSKLQFLWEDNKTGSKWATVNLYYFPDVLSEAINRPCTPENNEVYASSKRCNIMAGSIHGPCEVLPIDKFREESDRTQVGDTSSVLHPIFICRWSYDESTGIFQSITN